MLSRKDSEKKDIETKEIDIPEDKIDVYKNMFKRWDKEKKSRELVSGGTPRPISFNGLRVDKTEEWWETARQRAEHTTGFILLMNGSEKETKEAIEEGAHCGSVIVHSYSKEDVAKAIVNLSMSMPDAFILALPQIVSEIGDGSWGLRGKDEGDKRLRGILNKLQSGEEGGDGKKPVIDNPMII